MHLQVVHEDGELLPEELCREHLHELDELDELYGGDGLGMDGVGFEAANVADRADEFHDLIRMSASSTWML